MSLREQRLAEIRQKIPELTPQAALDAQRSGALLIDIRDDEERRGGAPQGARHIPRAFLELRIEDLAPSVNEPILLICAGGTRSLLAAESLSQMGYRELRSVAGGFRAWQAAGLPSEHPRMLSLEERERYGRHILIPEIGLEGQLKLKSSRVLIVGAGGLGSPAAYYLAAAGVGVLGLIDDDRVDRSNLQRQILHRDDRVGELKVESARKTLLGLNPDIEVRGLAQRLSPENVDEVLADYQLVIDGSDNFATRYLLNDACIKAGLPNVYGAIYRFEGQVSVFWPGAPRPAPCYRCLFPAPPPPELAPNCAEAGVLGLLPGVIGCLQAVEAVKLLLGLGEPLLGRFLQYDALSSRFTSFRFDRDPKCRGCGAGKSEAAAYELVDRACSSQAGS